MSRASLIDGYVAALPFAPVAIVPIASGGCRVETGAPGEAVAVYYFKPSHLDLLLGAAGLPEGRRIDQPPAAVAALIRRTAADMGAPFETAAELRAVAEREVDQILARVEATNQAGGLTALNKAFKAHRQAAIARAEKAQQYRAFIEERYTVKIVRQVAMAGRAI